MLLFLTMTVTMSMKQAIFYNSLRRPIKVTQILFIAPTILTFFMVFMGWEDRTRPGSPNPSNKCTALTGGFWIIGQFVFDVEINNYVPKEIGKVIDGFLINIIYL